MQRSVGFLLLLISLVASPFSLANEPKPLSIDATFLPQACVFSASFQQTQTLADVPKALISEGKLFFNCNTGLIWQQSSPLPETHIYTTSHQVLRLTKRNHLEQSKSKLAKNLAKMLTALMGGNTNYLNRYFTASYTGDSQVELLPKRQRIAQFISRITISKQPQLKQIFWENPIGNTTLLKIYELQNYAQFSREQCIQALHHGEQSCQVLSDEP